VLLTYNLSAIVYLPTRSQGYSNTAKDNIFIDTYKFINFTVSPLYNGLSDHDAQLLKINNIDIWIKVDQLDDTCFIIYCSTCFRR